MLLISFCSNLCLLLCFLRVMSRFSRWCLFLKLESIWSRRTRWRFGTGGNDASSRYPVMFIPRATDAANNNHNFNNTKPHDFQYKDWFRMAGRSRLSSFCVKQSAYKSVRWLMWIIISFRFCAPIKAERDVG